MLNSEIEATKVRYAAAKVAYESKFLPKLFGWKYENSIEGDGSWDGGWFSWDDYHLKNYKALRYKASYHVKMDYETMELIDYMDKNSFYKWCSDNSIPY
jgi:hypothetical protein